MAYASWTGSTAYAVGAICRATSVQASGLVFRCTTAGTSSTFEPTWPTDLGSTVTDNTVTWTAVSSTYRDLAEIAPSAVIELFELSLDPTLHGSSDIFRWHDGCNADISSNIVWNGNSYARMPIKADGFEYRNTGSLPRPTLTIANLTGVVTTLLLLVNLTTVGNDLGGATVKRIRTLKKYLDATNFPTDSYLLQQDSFALLTQDSDFIYFYESTTADAHAKFPDEIWYVDRKANESRDSVTFELASKFDMAGMMLPKRQIIANICQWKYRSSECGYTGSNYWNTNDQSVATLAADQCGKRLSSCKLRFGATAELPFGSFPGAGLTQ